ESAAAEEARCETEGDEGQGAGFNEDSAIHGCLPSLKFWSAKREPDHLRQALKRDLLVPRELSASATAALAPTSGNSRRHAGWRSSPGGHRWRDRRIRRERRAKRI